VYQKPIETAGFDVNTTAHHEYVPEIKRYIRTTKERLKATKNTLPFKKNRSIDI